MWQVIAVAVVIGLGVPLALFLAGWVGWLVWRTARDSLPLPVPPVVPGPMVRGAEGIATMVPPVVWGPKRCLPGSAQPAVLVAVGPP